tara:strand:- start:48 stop:677 length:630 start_codon:yes stop_codon:yes gene_type:complete
MDTKSLSQFKSKLAGGGARPNLFEVNIPAFPGAVSDAWGSGDAQEAGIFSFLCKAANLPASTINAVNVPFRGRQMKVAGERTIDDWTITVINDEDFKLRTAFERWANVMSKLDDATGVTNPTSYMADAYVHQLGRGREAFAEKNDGGQSAILRTYKFFDIFPNAVSPIDLSYDSEGTVEEFQVTFSVQFFTIGDSMESSSSDTSQVSIR